MYGVYIMIFYCWWEICWIEWERDDFVYVDIIMLFFVLSINEFLFDSWLVDFFYVCKKLIDF